MKSTGLFALTCLFASILFLASANGAQDPSPLNDASYLRKLSLHIRGHKPSTDEYEALKQVHNDGARQLFFENKIEEYLKSPLHADRLAFRLSERFRLKTPPVGTEYVETLEKNLQSSFLRDIGEDALIQLFVRMAKENLSWDALLTAKDYSWLLRPSANFDDGAFYRPVKPELKSEIHARAKDENGYSYLDPRFSISFASDDPRIAGALTTTRFISRYSTTNLNKNRGRAAAVFRIFLCDPMVPVIPANADRKTGFLKHSFDDEFQVTTEDALKAAMGAVSDAVRHGTDPRCMACHYKLDPLGLTFLNNGVALHSSPSPGALIYRTAKGEVVNRPVRGLGDLGAEIVRRPEYADCQVSYLWSDFVGKDIPLTGARRTEIVQEFERVGRRTNDFIKVLVSTPEFRSKPKRAELIIQTDVVSSLQRCDNCHSIWGKPSFVELTAGGGGERAKKWLKAMRYHLNLPDQSKDKMPEDWRTWDKNELERVKQWIEQGAHDAKGVPQLSPEDLTGKAGGAK